LISAGYALWILRSDIEERLNKPIDGSGSETPQGIKDAMMKMGPNYLYMTEGKKLYVNKGDGKWLRLNYKRKEEKRND